MIEVDMPPQDPCAWCLPTLSELTSTACLCSRDCGEASCPMGERNQETMQPVPEFAEAMTRLIEESKPDVLPDPDDDPLLDARGSLDRVMALHSRCPCGTCSSGCQKPVCKGCPDFWPCATVRTARGQSLTP